VSPLRTTLAAALLGVLCWGCSDEAPPPPEAKERPAPAKPKVADAAQTAEVVYAYDPTDKRDPFRSFVKSIVDTGPTDSPLVQFDISQLTLMAIVWGTDAPKALIGDPAGKGYIVIEGTVVGKNKGRIIAIEDNLVRVKETYVDALGRATTKSVEMRLREPQGG